MDRYYVVDLIECEDDKVVCIVDLGKFPGLIDLRHKYSSFVVLGRLDSDFLEEDRQGHS